MKIFIRLRAVEGFSGSARERFAAFDFDAIVTSHLTGDASVRRSTSNALRFVGANNGNVLLCF